MLVHITRSTVSLNNELDVEKDKLLCLYLVSVKQFMVIIHNFIINVHFQVGRG